MYTLNLKTKLFYHPCDNWKLFYIKKYSMHEMKAGTFPNNEFFHHYRFCKMTQCLDETGKLWQNAIRNHYKLLPLHYKSISDTTVVLVIYHLLLWQVI